MTHTLKEWRNLRGISMADLATRVGKTKPTIWKWETGRTSPRMSDMENLRKALSLKASDHITLPKPLT